MGEATGEGADSVAVEIPGRISEMPGQWDRDQGQWQVRRGTGRSLRDKL